MGIIIGWGCCDVGWLMFVKLLEQCPEHGKIHVSAYYYYNHYCYYFVPKATSQRRCYFYLYSHSVDKETENDCETNSLSEQRC